MAIVNSGNERSLNATIIRYQGLTPTEFYLNGLNHAGFLAFASLSEWTVQQMQEASLVDYEARLAALYLYIEDQYPDIDMQTVTINTPARRENLVSCPIPENPIGISFDSLETEITPPVVGETHFSREILITGLYGSREVTPELTFDFQSDGDMEGYAYYAIDGGSFVQIASWFVTTHTPVTLPIPESVLANETLEIALKVVEGTTNPLGATITAVIANAATVPSGITVNVDQDNKTFTVTHQVLS